MKDEEIFLFEQANEITQNAVNTSVRLAALMEYMDAGIIIIEVTDELKALYVSPGFFSALSRRPNKIGESLTDIIHREDLDSVRSKLFECAENDRMTEIIYRITPESGVFGWRHMRAVKIPYEGTENPVVIAIINDITELHTSTEQLSAILDNAPCGIARVIISEKWTVDFANHEFIDKFGCSAEEYEEKYRSDVLSAIFPDDRSVINAIVKSAVKDGKPFRCVYRMKDPDTLRYRWIMLCGVPIDDVHKLPVVLGIFTDITEQKELEHSLSEDKQRLSLAFGQTNIKMWEYSDRGKFSVEYEKNCSHIRSGISPFSEKTVHKNSREEYDRFMSRLYAHVAEASAVLQLNPDNSGFKWYRVSFKSISDSDGKFQKTVGIMAELPKINAQKARFDFEELLTCAISDSLIAVTKANITKNLVTSARVKVNGHLEQLNYSTYDEIVSATASYIVDSEDVYNFISKFSADYLKNVNESGNSWVNCEYRRKTPEGSIRWVSHSATVIDDPVSGDLFIFGYLRDVDVRKRWELSINRKIEYDSLFSLYTRETSEELVNYILSGRRRENSTLCAMIAISISNADEPAESNGNSSLNEARFSIAKLLRILLDHKYIIGTNDNNTFTVFVPDIPSPEEIRRRTEETAGILRKLLRKSSIGDNLNFNIGIGAAKPTSISYSELLELAVHSLEENKKNDSTFLEVVEKITFSGSIDSGIDYDESENSDCLMEPDANTAYISALKILVSQSGTDSAVSSVLEILGKYYAAIRVYTITLSQDGRELTLHNEWFKRGITSIVEKMRGVPITRFPIVKKALDDKKPVLFNDSDWKFICVPIIVSGVVNEFLCIDTPTKHIGSAELAVNTCSALTSGIIKCSADKLSESLMFTDPLTGINNRNRYSAHLLDITESSLSSMGVLFADINGLADVNRISSTSAGDKMIIEAADILRKHFSGDNVFRISGDEFIVLAPNLIYESFVLKTNCAQQEFDRIYPSGISIGSTWSDKDIKVKKLVDHAESLMSLKKQSYYDKKAEITILKRPPHLDMLLADIAEGKFRVYLQPKADIKTGRIVGAEALVRLFDEEKGIIPPSRFIPTMENENIIHHLDFYMFEKTLSIMDNWRKSGRKTVPLAMNFSRSTLLSPEALEKTVKIWSRFDVPASDFEIEITESIGSVERATVAAACKRFSDAGFRLSLDDFGSDYSSLSILSAIRFDVLKMDKSLINDIVANPASRAIIQTTVMLCKKLGITSVAEGVETEAQLCVLREAGCDIAQGYYFNMPLPADVFEKKYVTERIDTK